MPSYDIVCANREKCDYKDEWMCIPSTYSKRIVEEKCPKCGSTLVQDYSHVKVKLAVNGIEGISKIKPSIIAEESRVMKENDYLNSKAWARRPEVRAAEYRSKKFAEKMGVE
ncbi:MAG: hypothetical protein WC755_08965 [Candidatus Woesearchaeota archaeon]|jgi:hypothetical protein